MIERNSDQKGALRDAYKSLSVQFDHILIVCAMDTDHDEVGTELDVLWKGGWLQANGLADFAKHRIHYQKCNKSAPV